MLRCRPLFACIGLLTLTAACTTTVPDTREADIKAAKDVKAAWVSSKYGRKPSLLCLQYNEQSNGRYESSSFDGRLPPGPQA